MSIATTVRTAGPFAGTGSLVALPFAFKVFTASDLVVQRTNVAGDVATLTLTTHYSVSLNSDQDTAPGGTVTLVTALAVGETAALTSSVSATQPLQLASGGPFLPGQIEDALDRAMIVVQQQGVLGGQALRVPLGETALSLPSADQRANKALLFDADGDPYLAAPASGSAADVMLQYASTDAGKGASLVGSTDAGGYWQAANQEGINQEAGALLVNLRSMGADVTGAAASDAAMAAALSRSRYVLIPAGCKIALDTMLEPSAGTVIWMGPGAELFRRAAAASTDPVIWMHYSSIVVHGSGASSRIYSEKACPQGVVRIGAASMTTPIGNDMFWCGIKNLAIEGGFANELTADYGQSSGNPDIGILINAPQIDSPGATVIGIQASYFHCFEDLTIRKLNYGIVHRGYANAMRGSNIHFERLGSTGIRGRALDFNGGGESCYVNCWHHYSPKSDGIYARSITANTVTYVAIGNCVLNFMSEPGNAGSAKMYDIVGEAFQLTGQNYCTTAPSAVGTHAINVVSPSHAAADIIWTAGTARHAATDPAQIPLTIYGAASQATPFFAIRNSANTVQLKADADGSLQVLSGLYPGTTTAPGVFWKSGSGSPEGVITGPAGSMWTRTSGGAGTTLYIKESGTGNTGWVAK